MVKPRRVAAIILTGIITVTLLSYCSHPDMRMTYLDRRSQEIEGWAVYCAADNLINAGIVSVPGLGDSISTQWNADTSCAYVDKVKSLLLKEGDFQFADNAINKGIVLISVEGRHGSATSLMKSTYQGVVRRDSGFTSIASEEEVDEPVYIDNKSHANRVLVQFQTIGGDELGQIEFYGEWSKPVKPKFVAKEIIKYLQGKGMGGSGD